jgi:hypothetical protein
MPPKLTKTPLRTFQKLVSELALFQNITSEIHARGTKYPPTFKSDYSSNNLLDTQRMFSLSSKVFCIHKEAKIKSLTFAYILLKVIIYYLLIII